nr:hypothetical protein CFP56_09423 [Quercus suber]
MDRLHVPSISRLFAVRLHYNRDLEVDVDLYNERLVKAMEDHKVEQALSRTGVWIGFRLVYVAWHARVAQLNGERLRASLLVKDLWAHLDDPEVTHAVRDAQLEEKELMRDMLWTMLHRAVGLE